MKEDIKKKFLDILFEDEKKDDEIVAEGPIQDVRLSEETQKVLNAKDYLYNKNKRSSFLNINPKEKQEDDEKKEEITFIAAGGSTLPPSPIEEPSVEESPFIDNQYIMKPSISPMFGVIKKEEPVKVVNPKQETIKNEPVDIIFESRQANKTAPLRKYHDSYLGTIISPIFGYDVKNDLSNTMNLSIHKVESNYEPLEDGEEEAMSYYVKEKDFLDGVNIAAEKNDHCSIKQIDTKTIKTEVKKQINLEEENKPEEIKEPVEETKAEEPIEEEVQDTEFEMPKTETYSFDSYKQNESIDSLDEYFDRRLSEEVRGVSFDNDFDSDNTSEEYEESFEEEEFIEEPVEEEFVEEPVEDEFVEENFEEDNQEEIVEEPVFEETKEEEIEKVVPNTDENEISFDEKKIEEVESTINQEAFGEEFKNGVPESVYKDALNEERGFANTEEIDLFEDLFKEDEE